MAAVVVFGVSKTAELAHFYLQTDSEHEVVGFTVDQQYLPVDPVFCGLPVVAFESLPTTFPPTTHSLFAPITAIRMNKLRADIVAKGKAAGYRFISYISSHATVLSTTIGENCFIMEDNTVQPFVTIGDNVVLWSGNHIGHHSRIDDHVFITSQVVISGMCRVGAYSFIGVNASVRDGTRIAEGSFIAMASSITRDTQPWQSYAGNPAKDLRRSSLTIPIYRSDSNAAGHESND